jgi:Mrp family chromosome partitioning ATPase
VLADANLRRPTVGQLFGISDQSGLTDVLTDPSRQPELVSVDQTDLSVLPSGPIISLNPFEQLASPNMGSLIAQLTDQADVVILAAPPPLLFGESMLLASRVDGVVLAVRRGEADREEVRDVVENLRLVGARVLGTVLDDNRRRRVSLTSRRMVSPSPTTASKNLGIKKRKLIGLRAPIGQKRWDSISATGHQAEPELGD